jgi:alkyldihydroxyacetonephosphate synthase
VSNRPIVCAAYRSDAWPVAIKRIAAGSPMVMPTAVAFPQSTAEVARLVAWAAGRHVAVIPWGGGSSVTGAPLATKDAMIIDMRGLNKVLDIDIEDGRVAVQAGVLGGDLERALAERGLTTWFSPQSLDRSTVGGWIATRATGQLSSRWKGIEEAVLSLTVVLAGGRIVHVGTPPRGAVGFDLVNLFIGSEGALGIITEARLRVYPLTELHGLSAFALPNLRAGIDVLRAVMRAELRPAILRLYDSDEGRHLTVDQPPPPAVLLAAFGGHRDVAATERHVTTEIVTRCGGLDIGPRPTEAWVAGRYDFSRIESILAKPGGYAETIEVSHGWREIFPTYELMKRKLAPLAAEVLGHFSHTYSDGTSLYLILTGSAADDAEAVRRLEAIWQVAMATALHCGAVISHHHGVGRARQPYLADQLGEAVHLLGAVKSALDPETILHPESLRPPLSLNTP